MLEPETEALFGEHERRAVIERARRVPGASPLPAALAISEPEAWLAGGLAQGSQGWTVHAVGSVPEGAPDNVEPVASELPEIPVEASSLGLVTGAWITAPFEAWGPGFAEAALEALAPGGRVAIFFRGPSPHERGVEPTLPEDAGATLEDVGFEEVAKTKADRLGDGSRVYVWIGTAPS